MQLELDMETREHLEKQIGRMTRELGKMSHEEPGQADMLYFDAGARLWVVNGDDDPGCHWRTLLARNSESLGKFIPVWCQVLSRAGEATRQRDHKGRTAGNCRWVIVEWPAGGES